MIVLRLHQNGRLAALRSYDEPLVLLAGGADKKLPWEPMIAVALEKCRHIVAFGRDGDIVVNAVKENRRES